jgi:hypothetical protein
VLYEARLLINHNSSSCCVSARSVICATSDPRDRLRRVVRHIVHHRCHVVAPHRCPHHAPRRCVVDQSAAVCGVSKWYHHRSCRIIVASRHCTSVKYASLRTTSLPIVRHHVAPRRCVRRASSCVTSLRHVDCRPTSLHHVIATSLRHRRRLHRWRRSASLHHVVALPHLRRRCCIGANRIMRHIVPLRLSHPLPPHRPRHIVQSCVHVTRRHAPHRCVTSCAIIVAIGSISPLRPPHRCVTSCATSVSHHVVASPSHCASACLHQDSVCDSPLLLSVIGALCLSVRHCILLVHHSWLRRSYPGAASLRRFDYGVEDRPCIPCNVVSSAAARRQLRHSSIRTAVRLLYFIPAAPA